MAIAPGLRTERHRQVNETEAESDYRFAMSKARDSLNRRHRFPPEMISQAVWLYFRFPLSLRMRSCSRRQDQGSLDLSLPRCRQGREDLRSPTVRLSEMWPPPKRFSVGRSRAACACPIKSRSTDIRLRIVRRVKSSHNIVAAREQRFDSRNI
jgi:hypothetical protein